MVAPCLTLSNRIRNAMTHPHVLHDQCAVAKVLFRLAKVLLVRRRVSRLMCVCVHMYSCLNMYALYAGEASDGSASDGSASVPSDASHHVCIYARECIYTHKHTHTYTHAYTHIRTHTHTHNYTLCIYTDTQTHRHTWMNKFIFIHM